jgi:site-specific DNA-methyltransferase (adenine-specific)
MNQYKTDLLDLRCMDCMDLLRDTPDNAFDLAIVDPPYGIGAALDKRGGQQHGKAAAPSKTYGSKEWDNKTPEDEWYNEIFRVSKNQIIWGANHLGNMPPSSCWIVWDKLNGENGYADCELAWSSFTSAVRRFTFRWAGMLQGNMAEKENRIHPTQKPVALYKWLLHNYAKPGDKILDTHLGSCSIAIACHYAGYHLTGCELDEDYFKAGVERVKLETAQRDMFTEGLI